MMLDSRLLQIKQATQRRHEVATEGKLGASLDPEGELAMLIDLLNEVDRLKLVVKQALEQLLVDPDLSTPAPGLDGYREGFLREAIVALGAEVEWRASSHGTGVYLATERTPKECAQRAIKLWCAYRDLPRGKR